MDSNKEPKSFDSKNQNQKTPFAMVCEFAEAQDIKALEELLEKYPECLEKRDGELLSPVFKLAKEGKYSAVDWLVDKFKMDKSKIVAGCAVRGDEAKAEFYINKINLEKKKDDNKFDISILAEGYAYGGHHVLAKKCINKGANVTRIACVYADVGNKELVNEYIRYGACIDKIARLFKSSEKENKYKNLYEERDQLFKRAINIDGFTYITPIMDHKSGTSSDKNKKDNTSKYKLRINVDDISYHENQEEIVNIIQATISEHRNVISLFKFVPYSSATIIHSDLGIRLQFWKLKLELLKIGKNYSPELSALSKSVQNKKAREELRNYANAAVDESTINDKLESIQSAYNNSSTRFIGSAQFTLYLNKDCDNQKIVNFVSDLNSRLSDSGYQPGSTPASDLSVSKFISLRQDQLDDSKDYIPANETELMEKAKSQLEKSKIYNALSTSTKIQANKLAVSNPNTLWNDKKRDDTEKNISQRLPLSDELRSEVSKLLKIYENNTKIKHVEKKKAINHLLTLIDSNDKSKTYTDCVNETIRIFPKSTSGVFRHKVRDLFEKIKGMDKVQKIKADKKSSY